MYNAEMIVDNLNDQIIVVSLSPRSPASESGIQKGDKILAAKSKTLSWLILVARDQRLTALSRRHTFTTRYSK